MSKKKHKKNNDSEVKKSSSDFLYHLTLFFVLTLPFVFIKGLKDYVNAPKSAYVQIFVLILVALFFLKSIKDGKIVLKKSKLTLPFALFMAMAFLSSFYSINFYESITKFFHWFACFLFFLFTITNLKKKHIEKILLIIFITAVLNALFGIIQYIFNVQIVPQVAPPAAFFANKNMVGHFLVLCFPFGIVFFLKSQKNKLSFFMAFGSALIIVFNLYAVTRAVWLACSLEIFILCAIFFIKRSEIKNLFWNKTKTYSLLFSILFIVLMLNIKGGVDTKHLISKATSILDMKKGDSGKIRFTVWKNCFDIVKANPFLGVGLNNYQIISPIYNSSLYDGKIITDQDGIETGQLHFVHNDFLHILTELGIIGFSFFMWFGILLFYTLFKTIFNKEEKQNKQNKQNKQKNVFNFIPIAIFVSFVGFCVNAFFSFPLYLAVPPLLLMFFAGVSSIYCEEKVGIYVFNSKTTFKILFFITLILLLFISNYHIKNLQFEQKYLEMNILLKSEKWQRLIRKVDEGHKINPYSTKPFFYSGLAYMKLGNLRESLNHFVKIAKKRPYETPLLMNMANAYLRSGNYQTAVRFYKLVISMKPTLIKAHHNLAGLYIGTKRTELGLKELLIANKIEADAFVMFDIALILMHQKKHNLANSYFKKSLDLRNDKIKKYKERLFLYNIKKGNYLKAVEYYIQAIDPKSTDLAETYHRAGVSFYNNGNARAAVYLIKKAISKNPNDITMKMHLKTMSR